MCGRKHRESRLQGMAPEIDGKVYITEFEGVSDAADLPAPGTLATIEVTGANDYDLIARAVEFAAPAPRQVPLAPQNYFPILSSC